MIILLIVAGLLLVAGLTLALFVAEQKLPGDMHWSGRLLILPWLWTGFALDVLFNIFVVSFVLLDPPQELTLSARINRLEHYGTGYRQRLANWVCRAYLRPVDDAHC